MKIKILSLLAFVATPLLSNAYQLDSFTTTLQIGGNNYLSIAHKKLYTKTEAASNKSFIDLNLMDTKS